MAVIAGVVGRFADDVEVDLLVAIDLQGMISRLRQLGPLGLTGWGVSFFRIRIRFRFRSRFHLFDFRYVAIDIGDPQRGRRSPGEILFRYLIPPDFRTVSFILAVAEHAVDRQLTRQLPASVVGRCQFALLLLRVSLRTVHLFLIPGRNLTLRLLGRGHIAATRSAAGHLATKFQNHIPGGDPQIPWIVGAGPRAVRQRNLRACPRVGPDPWLARPPHFLEPLHGVEVKPVRDRRVIVTPATGVDG